MLLGEGGLNTLYTQFGEECARAGMRYRFVSAWEMYQAVEAIRQDREPE